MSATLTSYNALFRTTGSRAITAIRIPRLQRDYAQGRMDEATASIRTAFLDVLHRALTDGPPVGLDFVFGDVSNGVLSPLDGQQRLTTLFLLHWYLAARANRLDDQQGWKNFTYETRASARLFCERLVQSPAPPTTEKPSAWIQDQSWFLSTWHHDPTVTSMLVVLDALHDRFRGDDAGLAWSRLVDSDNPAISFHLLPIREVGRPDELYIKMNSRGKPLTPFENFKACFEQSLTEMAPARARTFADRVDGAWSDMLWPMRGTDNVIDDEFMRYLDFIAEVCAWREGHASKESSTARADAAFGAGNPDASANLDLLFAAFDTWCSSAETIPAFFALHFTLDDHEPGKVAIYSTRAENHVDLVAACCRVYGTAHGQNRAFTLQRTLLLYATLVHRVEGTADFARRIRVLRNLIEASENELGPAAMPRLIASVRRFMGDGDLKGIQGFNQRQLQEERQKADLLQSHASLGPTLFALEDHPLLRGSLEVFDLDATTFERRAESFRELFADEGLYGKLTGALLACGDYTQPVQPGRSFRLGSARATSWRELFKNSGRPEQARTRDALMTLLDQVAAAEGPMPARLDALRDVWLASREAAKEFDWRYYITKHPEMREGTSGIYVGSGYSLCMLFGTRVSGYYRDPYLLAMLRKSGAPAGTVDDPWFTGYETAHRWMRLTRSGTELRCSGNGIALRPPVDATQRAAFDDVCTKHHVGADLVMLVPRVDRAGRAVDTCDRVALGAALLRNLVAAGC